MLFQLFDLLGLMIYVIFLLIQLKLQIFLLFLKFYDFLFEIFLSCALLPSTCLTSIHTWFFIFNAAICLIFKLGINETLPILFCIIALTCQVSQVLLRDNLIVILLNVLFR